MQVHDTRLFPPMLNELPETGLQAATIEPCSASLQTNGPYEATAELLPPTVVTESAVSGQLGGPGCVFPATKGKIIII